ncbi:MAG TPA: peptide MFS transporter [Pyrinomonadaceae bacterium]|nr:peptide MFS transporter [Pyrinomonadaceae bacterium]
MNTTIDATGATAPAAHDTGGLGGHPRGLTTLFFTEVWERFSYYGMRALLMLYMTKALAEGGLGFDEKYAGLIYGTYTSSVFWTPLIGGWLADKYLGARRAVFVGGCVIALGHFSLVFDTLANFYGGLVLIAAGTGLLKPNISAMVGNLYAEGDERRDAGFSYFYMAVNLGAFFAPIVCGYLGQKISWHYGFAAAGVGMVLGLVQYVLGRERLRGVGEAPAREKGVTTPKDGGDIAATKRIGDELTRAKDADATAFVLAVVGLVVGASVGYFYGGAGFVSALFPGVAGFFAGYIAGVVRNLGREESRRVFVILILFAFSAVFWMSFEQAGSSLTLFADRLTRNNVAGWEFPSSWFQSVQPIFVILFAPVFAWMWIRMGRRQPSSPAKFAYGLFFAAAAFGVVAFAATLTGAGRVSPLWLVAVYFIQTAGELCLSPVGLSTTTKLAPARMAGLMRGVWYLSISIGSYFAGLSAGFFDEQNEGALVQLFGVVALITVVAAALLAALTPMIRKLTPRT